MFHHLMVPLDGSELAERALPIAEQIAKANCATIDLVRVVRLPDAHMTLGGAAFLPQDACNKVIAGDVRSASDYLDAQCQRLASNGVAGQTATLTEHGHHVASALLTYMRDKGVDMVVMCTHGRSGLARFTSGSVAERLLRHGTAPILLVHASSAPISLEHLLVPLDGSLEHEDALPVAASLAPSVHDVSLIRVIRIEAERVEAQQYLTSIAQRLAVQGIVVGECHVVLGDPTTEIKSVTHGGQLVVLATRAGGQLTGWASRSVAERLDHDQAATMMLVRTGTTGRLPLSHDAPLS
jgi:nucleotide-binding universal stress UspA family protein